MLAAPAVTMAVLLDSNRAPLSGCSDARRGQFPDLVKLTRPEASASNTMTRPVAAPEFRLDGRHGDPFVRLAGGWSSRGRMTTRAVRPAAAHVQAAAAVLAKSSRCGVCSRTRVVRVAVPVLVGWLKPAVVLACRRTRGLSPAQIEALLAHELAHVHRHDYLVNLLQSFAEVVLFYHPAVWWLSRRVRTERELCCDDLAVGLCDRWSMPLP
jgi:hypothetical protein